MHNKIAVLLSVFSIPLWITLLTVQVNDSTLNIALLPEPLADTANHVFEEILQQKIISKKIVIKTPLIDINSAMQKEFEALPSIGSVIALRIIEYRNSHKRYGSLSELKNVKGIGEKRFANIKEFLRPIK